MVQAFPGPRPDTVYTRTFRRALKTLGSAEQLAKRLGASIEQIEAWTDGRVTPPSGVFLAAIDIVARGS